MGINTNVYVYWGVRTEWNKDVSDRQEELWDLDLDDVDILSDGMSCEYMVFGVQLYDSGDARWGTMINANEVEINDAILDKMREEYMAQFKLRYPDQYEWLAEKPWMLINLVHYS